MRHLGEVAAPDGAAVYAELVGGHVGEEVDALVEVNIAVGEHQLVHWHAVHAVHVQNV